MVVVLGPSSLQQPPSVPPRPDVTYNILSNTSQIFTPEVAFQRAGQLTSTSIPPAYIAEEFSPSERFQDSDTFDFTAGSGEVTQNFFKDETYRNVPLVDSYTYTVFLRGYLDANAKRRRRASLEVVCLARLLPYFY